MLTAGLTIRIIHTRQFLIALWVYIKPNNHSTINDIDYSHNMPQHKMVICLPKPLMQPAKMVNYLPKLLISHTNMMFWLDRS